MASALFNPEKFDYRGLIDRGAYRRSAIKDKFDGYKSLFSKDDDRALYDGHVAAILKEQGFDLTKIPESPRSIYSVEKLYERLALFGPENKVEILNDKHLDNGFKMALRAFGFRKLVGKQEALKLYETPKAVKMNTSAGLPSLSKKADAIVYGVNRASQTLEGVKNPNPCIAYKRTQGGGKTRLVWGYPLDMTLIEAKFARPLTDLFLRLDTPMAFGMSKLQLGCLLETRVNKKNIVCLDYSKFDSSIQASLITKAFNIVKTWFELETEEDQKAWEIVVKYFITTPIVMPNGKLYTGKRHGVPSGSYFTQIIDSVVNVMIIGAISSHLNLDVSAEGLFVLGDDSIFSTNKEVDFNAISRVAKLYGINVSAEKSTLGVKHFLGATWERCFPRAELTEVLAKAIYPESFRDYQGDMRNGPISVLIALQGQYVNMENLYRDKYCKRHLDCSDLSNQRVKFEVKKLPGSIRWQVEEKELSGDAKFRKMFDSRSNVVSAMYLLLK